MSVDATNLLLFQTLNQQDRTTIFQHFVYHLASYRKDSKLYGELEYRLYLSDPESTNRRDQFNHEIEHWGHTLLENARIVCKQESNFAECPPLEKSGKLPKVHDKHLTNILNSILLLHVTTSKQYSARTRSFLSGFGVLDEYIIASTLKNSEQVTDEAQTKARSVTANHAEQGMMIRTLGMGLGAVAGGVLVGVTGGLAAPLVGAGVTTFLGFLGLGGTGVGLLTGGLAGSSVVCGTLFGAYGARSTANMVERHARELRDLELVPIREIRGDETLGIRLCVSGWLSCREDVTAPWSVFGGDNTYALQWEVDALQELSDALIALLKSHAVKYLQAQIVKRTILASLMASLAPIAWLKIGQIIDNPWMNAKALAVKAGAVLGDLLSNHVFGNRPVTLTGYSLGSLVIFEALKYLASLPPANTAHLIQDVYLFGTPVPADALRWSAIRRLVSGRLVNGYSCNDYVLAILSRVSDASWHVAGFQPVDVMGVENILCENVEGHTMWRRLVGKCLRDCNAPGIISDEVGDTSSGLCSEVIGL